MPLKKKTPRVRIPAKVTRAFRRQHDVGIYVARPDPPVFDPPARPDAAVLSRLYSLPFQMPTPEQITAAYHLSLSDRRFDDAAICVAALELRLVIESRIHSGQPGIGRPIDPPKPRRRR